MTKTWFIGRDRWRRSPFGMVTVDVNHVRLAAIELPSIRSHVALRARLKGGAAIDLSRPTP
jgi:hypothetical protein